MAAATSAAALSAAADLFMSIGLDRRTAENAVANANLTANLSAVIREAGVPDGCRKAVGSLLFSVATKYPGHALVHRPRLLEYIVSAKIKYTTQLDAALLFLGKVGSGSLDVRRFEEECGVGVDVSIEKTVVAVLEENMDAIMEQRYHINVGNLCGQVRERHAWADAKIVKELIDDKLHGILGERTEADDERPFKKKKEKHAKAEEKTNGLNVSDSPPSEEELIPFGIFQAPEENSKTSSLDDSNQEEERGPSPPIKKNKTPFKTRDDINLTVAILATTCDATVGTNQKGDVYWKAVEDHYNIHLKSNPPRTGCSLMNRWRKFVNLGLSKMSGIVSKIEGSHPSGLAHNDMWNEAKKQFELEMNKSFIWDECWNLVKDNPNWKLTPEPFSTAGKHKPSGNGKGNVRGKGDPVGELVYDLCDDEVGSLREEDLRQRPLCIKKTKRQISEDVVLLDEKVASVEAKIDSIVRTHIEEKEAKMLVRQRKEEAFRAQIEYFEHKKRLDAQMAEEKKNSLERYRDDKILYMPIHPDLDDVSKMELVAHKQSIRDKRLALQNT